MALKKIALGWDRPLVQAAAAHLLDGRTGTTDLEGLLAVVPTREAGRKLKAEMALRCMGSGGGLLGARIETPPDLLSPRRPPEGLAGPAAVKTVWTEFLAGLELQDYPALFPCPVEGQERRSWAFRTGEALEALRYRLLEAGLTITDVCRRAGGEFEEADRWEELQRLEEGYLRGLTSIGLTDRVTFTRRYAEEPELPGGVERIVIAGCPDPQPVAMRAFQVLARSLDVELLIHSPAELLDRFDEWGRPLAGLWGGDEEVVPGTGGEIHVAETPEDQAAVVCSILAGDGLGPRGCPPACGTADPALVPFLQRELRKAGIASFDPAGRPMEDHPLYGLLRAFRNYLGDGRYESLAVLLRQGYVIDYLARSGSADPGRALAEMDRLQNLVLPESARDVREACGRASLVGMGRVENAAAAFRCMEDLAVDFRRRPFVEAVRTLLMTLSRGLTLTARRPEGRAMLQAVRIVDESLGEMEKAQAVAVDPAGTERFDILLNILAPRKLEAERPAGSVALQGWLELPWIDAPCLVVAGCNEGRVPESLPSDPFLTDSLRRAVGLRSDADRDARDAYLARALIASRPSKGRVIFVLGRQSVEGDPLLPSRLFFAGPAPLVAARAKTLFAPTAEKAGAPPPAPLAVLDPWSMPRKTLDRLRSSDFRLYMACPFRFYLKRILGLERIDDLQEELNALDYGNIIHYALQGLGDGAWRTETDRAKIGGMLSRRCDRWLQIRFGDRVPPTVAVQVRSVKRRLSGAAAEQSRLAAAGWEVAAAEIDVEMQCGGTVVSGRIDRIDRHRDSGRYRIIDYKTTDRRSLPVDSHTAPARPDGAYGAPARRGRGRSWKDLQLPLYREMAAAAGAAPTDAGVGVFLLPAAAQEAGLLMWEDFGDNLRLSALACAGNVVERIRRGIFWPPADAMPWDEFEFFRGGIERTVMPPPEGTDDGQGR